MADRADHRRAVEDVAFEPGLHLVERVGRGAHLGGTAQGHLRRVRVAAQRLGGFGEAAQGGGDAAGEQVAGRADQQEAAQEPAGGLHLPLVREGVRLRTDHRPRPVVLLQGGGEVAEDRQLGAAAEAPPDIAQPVASRVVRVALQVAVQLEGRTAHRAAAVRAPRRRSAGKGAP